MSTGVPPTSSFGAVASAAFRATLDGSALPYGYTLTIWSSGTLLSHVRGAPSVFEIFLFVAGGVTAFVALVAVAALGTGELRSLPRARQTRLLAGSVAWLGAGGGVGATALVAEIPSGIAWPLGSFAATSIFLIGTGLQLALAARAAGCAPTGRVSEL